ncbi:MAG: ABC transporter substrate-binding protein [Nitrospirae bacterium]|nr:ABC transporter substrate-binding protein [Nitrospirota bacterium]
MKRTVISIVLFTAVIGVVFAGCRKDGDSSIKVGVIAELTGDIPAVGASCRNASEMAVKEINDAGGIEIGGRKYKVELFIEDSASKPDQAASSAQKLITQKGVVAIVGPNSSSNAIPASEIAESAKVVLITPWSTNPKTTLDAKTGAPKRYVFRAAFIDPFQGRVVAKFALNTMKAKKAAVLYDVASDYNKGIAEFFKNTFEENGGQVVAFESYTTNDKDFSAQLTKMKSAGPDVIFLPNYYNEVPLQVQQAHRLGIRTPFLGSDSWGSQDLTKLCGSDCEGYYFTTHYSPDSAAPAAKKFIQAYTVAYGKTPDDVAALTYDSFGLLRQALAGAGKLDRDSVRNALAGIQGYEGVTGKMQFREGSGDPIKSAVVVRIQGEKFVWFADAQP